VNNVRLFSVRVDRVAPECVPPAALSPYHPPSAMVCDRRSCSTGHVPSILRSGRRYGRPNLWQRSSAGMDAQHDHLPVLERDKAVIEVGSRDWDVLAKPQRIVLVDPSIIARLGGPIVETLEGGARVLVMRKAFRAMVAGRCRPVERTFALAPVEADQGAIRARAPDHPVLVDVTSAHANAFFRDGVELTELALGINT